MYVYCEFSNSNLFSSVRKPVYQQLMLHTKLILESKLIWTYFQSNSTPRAPNHSGSILHT